MIKIFENHRQLHSVKGTQKRKPYNMLLLNKPHIRSVQAKLPTRPRRGTLSNDSQFGRSQCTATINLKFVSLEKHLKTKFGFLI